MAPPIGSLLSGQLRVFQISGANTNVGKTIFSTILCLTMKNCFPEQRIHYLKPISTGADTESDKNHLLRFTNGSLATATILQQYKEPISPHLAAINPPSDHELLEKIRERIKTSCTAENGTLIMETAGGVHSPSATGTSQIELYRPLRLPVLLVADSHLGGISSTISAFESLRIRGYDLDGVLIFRDGYYRNHDYLSNYFSRDGPGRGILTAVVEPPPKVNSNMTEDIAMLTEYYDRVSNSTSMIEFAHMVQSNHEKRIEALNSMATEASQSIWYPFTQHESMSPKDITVIDSAYGDFFQVFKSPKSKLELKSSEMLLHPMFDGSASWWTQGLGHGDASLSISASYAAGRYGHVMFAGAIHEPALHLAKLLLKNIPSDRLSRVFFSDNGSTGVEVGVKMALKAARQRYGNKNGQKLEILGLKGSYHGDTIGAMDCSEPGTFNSEVDWYEGKGFWFEFPKIGMKKGHWIVSIPQSFDGEEEVVLGSDLTPIFQLSIRRKSSLATVYEKYIKNTLVKLAVEEGRRFGALIMEPVVLGAGGMLFCDPLFQSILVSVIRNSSGLFGAEHPTIQALTGSWAGIPVVFDEVFTGLYRLGHLSSSALLQTSPDICVYAKLLTGGLVPMCVTMASESIFEAFKSEKKQDALLHGHSYTAHAVGCEVARESVKKLLQLEKEGAWSWAKEDWNSELETSTPAPLEEGKASGNWDSCAWSVWSRGFVSQLSHKDNVETVWALGSVLAIRLKDENSAGYCSNSSQGFLDKMKLLKSCNGMNWNIHARALGSTIYMMVGQNTYRAVLHKVEQSIDEALQ